MVLVSGELLRRAALRLAELTEHEPGPGVLLQELSDHELVELLMRASRGEQLE
jgi:hypothetical protein